MSHIPYTFRAYVDPVMTVPRHTISFVMQGGYVSPKTLIDLKGHSTCNFKTFLKAFLVLCLDGKDSPANLLQRCRDAVLPICNAHFKPNKGTKRTRGKDYDYGANIHGHLT
jgi:hypothetical protein